MNAISALILSVNDDSVDSVAVHDDPTTTWTTLKNAYQSGDQSQILTLTGQLQNLKMEEGASVEDYLKRVQELKNRLASMDVEHTC